MVEFWINFCSRNHDLKLPRWCENGLSEWEAIASQWIGFILLSLFSLCHLPEKKKKGRRNFMRVTWERRKLPVTRRLIFMGKAYTARGGIEEEQYLFLVIFQSFYLNMTPSSTYASWWNVTIIVTCRLLNSQPSNFCIHIPDWPGKKREEQPAFVNPDQIFQATFIHKKSPK